MGNKLTFYIIPFDPTVTPDATTQLPVDPDDLAQQLCHKWPNAEARIDKSDGKTGIRLYISTESYGPWIVARFMEHPSQFCVSGWPKRMAKELIFWYRHYVPLEYPLFLLIPEYGYVAELTGDTTLDDIEKMYPFPMPDE